MKMEAMMETYDAAVRAHEEFQAARQAAVREIDAEIEGLEARKREVLALGKTSGSAPKKRGRPRKEARDPQENRS
jgi:hypothetical protein